MDQFRQLYEQAADGDIDGFMSGISERLNELVREEKPVSIRTLESDASFMEVRQLSHQDPYTHRGFSKPRGYAGDAVLLDYIYGTAPIPEGTTETGARILAWCQQNSVAFQAVRARRSALAQHMLRAKQLDQRSKCLSVACGHLRELALVDGGLPENLSVVALDQDPLSLAVVQATYGKTVVPMHVQIGSLISGPSTMDEQFDLITVAGLYDYLDAASAERLTTTLGRCLKPGGRLIISNFIDCWERGYMEYLMKWKLLYRSLEQVNHFASGLGYGYSIHCSSDSTRSIAYLQVDRE